MRAEALAVAIALLLGGCAARAPAPERNRDVSYNYRELEPGRQGALTGPDGVWTIDSSGRARTDTEKRREECAPRSDTGASVERRADGSCPAAPTVLLPKP